MQGSLSSDALLVHYDTKRELRLACDASSHGLGAVISHVMDDGEERPIAFASRTLTGSERNYAQIEKEALSLVFGVKRFHQFLYGRKFTLMTDHKPLQAILGPKSAVPTLAAARMQSWALVLSAYDYDLVYRRSEEHSKLTLCQDCHARIQESPWRVKFILSEQFGKIFQSWPWTLHKQLAKIHC